MNINPTHMTKHISNMFGCNFLKWYRPFFFIKCLINVHDSTNGTNIWGKRRTYLTNFGGKRSPSFLYDKLKTKP